MTEQFHTRPRLVHLNRIRPEHAFILLLALALQRPLPAAALDFSAPGMQSLKADYDREKALCVDARLRGLTALLNEFQQRADQMLTDSKRSGNISAMAAARTAVSDLEKCKKAFDERKDFELPKDVRRELRQLFDDCRTRKAAIEDAYVGDIDALDFRYAEQLSSLTGLPAEAPKPPEEILQDLVGTPPLTHPVTPAVTNGAAKPVKPKDDSPRVLASQGETNGWVNAGRWECELSGLHIFSVKTLEISRPTEEKDFDPIIERNVVSRYIPIRVLPLGLAKSLVYRVVSIRGKEPAEVVRWPEAGNRWTLVLRARPGAEAPSQAAVTIQVAGVPADQLKLVGEDAGGLDAGKAVSVASAEPIAVTVSITTEPPGATVYIDGKMYMEGKKPAVTPCAVTAPPGTHAVRLAHEGLDDAVFPSIAFREGKDISWKFAARPTVTEKTIRVSATATWTASGVEVREGDTLTIESSGNWTCGSRHEQVDANGYPNDRRFTHYYAYPKLNPRLILTANYGALLMRVGTSSANIVPVGTRFASRMPIAGELFFDINEEHGSSPRRDNDGQIEVRIQVRPAP